jgi:hypothetical protein
MNFVTREVSDRGTEVEDCPKCSLDGTMNVGKTEHGRKVTDGQADRERMLSFLKKDPSNLNRTALP